MPNADDPRGRTPMNTDDELRHEIHMKMLSKSKSAKDLGELTVVPLGFAVSIALDLLRKSNLQRAIEELENFNLPQYDHSKCIDKNTCIGYENAQSDFDNEKELRINELQAELQQAESEEV